MIAAGAGAGEGPVSRTGANAFEGQRRRMKTSWLVRLEGLGRWMWDCSHAMGDTSDRARMTMMGCLPWRMLEANLID